MVSAFLLTVICSFAMVILFFYLSEDLPKITSLADYRPPIITTVYSDDNRKIAEFYKQRRVVIPLSDMPAMLKEAFVAAEDARFFKHQGIDVQSIVRAFVKNMEAGTIVQGGSTITQQVTKSFLLTPERSYSRKVKEAILAYRIDRAFTKEEVLFLYLNQIYLGHGAYGVEAAAENYFGKSCRNLNLAECTILAGLPQAPSRYSPFRFPQRARQRQIYVLNRMVTEGYITEDQKIEAINTQLDIKPRKNLYIEKVPFYTEHIRREIAKRYGDHALYNEGLQIYAAVNVEMQKIAREEIVRGLQDLDKRQGYRGAAVHLKPEAIEPFVDELRKKQSLANFQDDQDPLQGVVVDVDDDNGTVSVRLGDELGKIHIDDMRWARKPNPDVPYYSARLRKPSSALSPGDVILVRPKDTGESANAQQLLLEQTPKAEAALLCIEAENGYVKAMIGGRDFRKTQFNRAVQSRRQPGSAFKAIIYAAALDKGYTPASVIIDSPIVFRDDERDVVWKPKNYKEKFFGPTLLRTALAKSMNVITVKILRDIGIDYTINYARKLGIESPLSRDLSIALGSSGVSLLEIVNAYSVFCNLGYRIEPTFIRRIVDRDGKVLEENRPETKKVMDKATAYLMTSLMESVVNSGTGWRARALKRPVAGKTGTSNDLFDAWFIGYSTDYITGTWVGFDAEASLGEGETGSRSASPIWVEFMKRILADKPVQTFPVPENIVFTKIDAKTGLLPIPESKETVFECFKEGTVPEEYTRRPNAVTEAGDFFKQTM
jgi:penicillin-binding protein 1A